MGILGNIVNRARQLLSGGSSGSSGTTATTSQKGHAAAAAGNNTSKPSSGGSSSGGSSSGGSSSVGTYINAQKPKTAEYVAWQNRETAAKLNGRDSGGSGNSTAPRNNPSPGQAVPAGPVAASNGSKPTFRDRINDLGNKPVTLGDSLDNKIESLKESVGAGLARLNDLGRNNSSPYSVSNLRFGPTIAGRIDGTYNPSPANNKPATVNTPASRGPQYDGTPVSSDDYRDKIIASPVDDRRGVLFGNSDTVTQFDIDLLRETNRAAWITNPNFQGHPGMDVGAFKHMYSDSVNKANAPNYNNYTAPGTYKSPTGKVSSFYPGVAIPKGWSPVQASGPVTHQPSGRGTSIVNETVEAAGYTYAKPDNSQRVYGLTPWDVVKGLAKSDWTVLDGFKSQFAAGSEYGEKIGAKKVIGENLRDNVSDVTDNPIRSLLRMHPLYRALTTPAHEFGTDKGAANSILRPVVNYLPQLYVGADGRMYDKKSGEQTFAASMYGLHSKLTNPLFYVAPFSTINKRPLDNTPMESSGKNDWEIIKHPIYYISDRVSKKRVSELNEIREDPAHVVVKSGVDIALAIGSGGIVGLGTRSIAKGAVLAGDVIGVGGKAALGSLPKIAKYVPGVVRPSLNKSIPILERGVQMAINRAPTIAGAERLIKRLDFIDDVALIGGAVPYGMGYNTDIWSNLVSGQINPQTWITRQEDDKAEIFSEKWGDRVFNYFSSELPLEKFAEVGHGITYRTPTSIRYSNLTSPATSIDGKTEMIPSGLRVQKSEYVPAGGVPDVYVHDKDAFYNWNRVALDYAALPKSYRETVSNPPTPSQRAEIANRLDTANDVANFMEKRNEAIYNTSDITIYGNMIRGDIHGAFSPVSRGIERVAPGRVSQNISKAVDKIKPKPQYLDHVMNMDSYKAYAASRPTTPQNSRISPHPDDIIVNVRNGQMAVNRPMSMRPRAEMRPAAQRSATVKPRAQEAVQVRPSAAVSVRSTGSVSTRPSVPAKLDMPAKVEVPVKMEVPVKLDIKERIEIPARPEVPIKPEARVKVDGGGSMTFGKPAAKKKKQKKTKFKELRDVYNVRDPFENRKMI